MIAAKQTWIRLSVAGLLLSLCAGCACPNTEVIPPQGGLVTYVKAPLTTQFNGNPCGADKKFSESQTFLFCPWPLTGSLNISAGDSKIKEIAGRGGIDQVSYADYEFLSILGIYAQFTVNVYGN